MRILLAEDDPSLGVLLLDFMDREGFEVELCKNGELAWQAFLNQTFDLCLLDVMMPGLDGYTLAQEIRKRNKTIPIIFITAKSQKADKQHGYSLGADDYISKPFDEDELIWKIKALVRRAPAGPGDAGDSFLTIGKYFFEPLNQSLTINGVTRRITEKESAVLAYLGTRCNTVVKREALLVAVWGENDYFLGRSLDVFVSKIRKYLKDDPALSIENVFGVGFMLKVVQ